MKILECMKRGDNFVSQSEALYRYIKNNQTVALYTPEIILDAVLCSVVGDYITDIRCGTEAPELMLFEELMITDVVERVEFYLHIETRFVKQRIIDLLNHQGTAFSVYELVDFVTERMLADYWLEYRIEEKALVRFGIGYRRDSASSDALYNACQAVIRIVEKIPDDVMTSLLYRYQHAYSFLRL